MSAKCLPTLQRSAVAATSTIAAAASATARRQLHFQRPTSSDSGRMSGSDRISPFAKGREVVSRTRSTLETLRSARSFHTSVRQQHGSLTRPEPGTGIKVTFRDSKGTDIKTVEANEADDLLSIAHEYDIDLEGACEGSIACSTCHVILDPDIYDALEEPCDDENDMLDLAFGLTDTSRLGCQVKLTKELDGMVAQLPSATRNMYVDGAKGGHGN